ncbi:MAG: hypothetical protein ABIN89_28510 [Chitinophagaceae bacterium]
MLQNQISANNLAMVGEEISQELGAKMVKDFQDVNPNENTANYIGRNILERILAQPGCEGIRFYNAINEMGRTTLVYVGIDANENIIKQYVGVNNFGELVSEDGIIADRSVGAPPTSVDTVWTWF